MIYINQLFDFIKRFYTNITLADVENFFHKLGYDYKFTESVGMGNKLIENKTKEQNTTSSDASIIDKPHTTPNTPKYEVKKLGALSVVEAYPDDIMPVVANKKHQEVTSGTAINGTFFWKGKPVGIIVYNGNVLSAYSSHGWRGFGQSVLYFDGQQIAVTRIKQASELGDLSKIKWAIGGCGIITPYGYDPAAEGFVGAYADILRKCNKTALAVKGNKVFLVSAKNISHDTLISELVKNGFEIAVSLDGGGSSFLKCNGEVILPTDGRTINNWVVAL